MEKTIVKNNGGLLECEQSIMDDLVSAWDKFLDLEKQHPADVGEFCDSIYRLQGILAMRVLRRAYPDYYSWCKD